MWDSGRDGGDIRAEIDTTLIGRDWPRDVLGDGYSGGFEWLSRTLDVAAGQIEELAEADFEGAGAREVTHQAGDAVLTQRDDAYLRLFALPNLWFHLSMAYAIARREGLEIGKTDYDGWHAYEAGFRFVE